MADRPILFSGPMVRALLAGTKTQTRRILKPQPSAYTGNPIPPEGLSWTSKKRDEPYFAMHDDQVHWCWWDEYNRQGPDWIKLRIAKGDRLYVREHWRTRLCWDNEAPRDMSPDTPIEYVATPSGDNYGRFRQGMHMPRWASRLTLTVTDVRVERLHDCSEADAWAEGCVKGEPDDVAGFFPAEEPDPSGIGHRGWDTARDWYADLWDSINGPGAWGTNPWVAAYTFTVQRGNIDAQA